MFTVDASVHLNSVNSSEAGSAASQAFLERLHRRPWPVHSPTLLLVEIAGAVSRVRGDPDLALRMSEAIRSLPGQIWIALDDTLAEAAAEIAARHHLRGADAVYAGVARAASTAIVTRDHEQLDRLRPVVTTLTPEEALVRLESMEATGTA